MKNFLSIRHAFTVAFAFSLPLTACHKEKESPKVVDSSSIPSSHDKPKPEAKSRITLLLEQAKVPSTLAEEDKQIELVNELGREKAVEAIQFLGDHLFKIIARGPSGVDFEGSYPCCAALIAIGEPSVAEVTKLLEHETSPSHQLVFVFMLEKIKGKEWTAEYLRNPTTAAKAKASADDLEKLAHWASSISGGKK